MAIAAMTAATSILAAEDATEQFNFATGLLIRDEPALAAEEFQKLVESNPDFAELDSALYRWGEALAKSNQEAAARPVFERLIRERPQSERIPEAHYWLARIVGADDPRTAAEHYSAVFNGAPGSPLAEASRYGAIDALYKAGAWKEVAESCATALQNAPDGKFASETRLLRAWSLEKLGDDAAALDAYRDFAGRHADAPQAAECRLQAAECLRRMGRHEEAANAFAELLGTDGAIGTTARISRAFSLHELGRPAEAAASFADAAQRLGDDPKAVTCILNAAREYAAADDMAKAAEMYAAAEKAGQDSSFQLGMTLMRQDRADDALAAFRRAIEHETADTPADQRRTARLAIANILYRKENFAEAVDAFRQAIEKEGDATPAADKMSARLPLAFALFRLERFGEADAAFADAIALAPEGEKPDAGAMYQYAWCALHADNSAEARKRFEALAAAHPENDLAPESLVRAAGIASESGDADAASALYKRTAEIAPDSPWAARALVNYSGIAIESGHFDEALAAAQKAVEKARGDDALLAFSHASAGEALMGLNRFEEAIEEFNKVKTDAADIKASCAFGTAIALRELKRFDEAAAAFAPIAASETRYAEESLWWRALSFADAEKQVEASECFGEFIRRFPDSGHASDAAYLQALAAYRVKDWAKADTLYAGFLKAYADSPLAVQARYDWAWVALESGDQEKGAARLREVIAAAPQSALAADAGFRVGEIEFEAERHAEAAAAYETALKVEGIDFADKLLYKLGWANVHLDDKAKALAAFERLAREFPESELAGESLYMQGELLSAMGKRDEAIAALAKVQDPAFAEKALHLAAECHRGEGRHGDAIAACDKLLGQFPEGELRAQALLCKGHSLRAAGADADALDAYAAVVAATETIDAAQAIMGQGDIHFAAQRWQDAAKAYLKIDILYGYEELKPRALLMLARTWKKAGDDAKSAQYLEQLKTRYPDSAEAKEAL